MKTSKILFTLSIQFLIVILPVKSQETLSNTDWLPRARLMLSQGQFRQCIQLLNTHLPLFDFDKEQIQGLHLRATAHQALGQFQEAYDDLKQARLFSKDHDAAMYIKTLTRLGDLSLSVGQVNDALKYAQKATDEAKKNNDLHLHAVTLNNLGNTLVATGIPPDEKPLDDLELPPDQRDLTVALRGPGSAKRKIVLEPDQPSVNVDYFQNAIKNYEHCIKLALDTKDQPLAIRATINKARTALGINDFNLTCHSLTQSGNMIAGIKESFERGYLQLSRGVLAARIAEEPSGCQHMDLKSVAADAFNDALQMGHVLGNRFLQSQAQGELARLYERDNRLDEAIQLTRGAVFAAHQQANPRLIYKWHWQLGRFLGQMDKNQEAISQYQQAIEALNAVRNLLSVGYRKIPNIFRQHIKPVYYELAEFYLKEAKEATSRSEQQSYLRLARDTLEGMKSAELQDYFQEECVIAIKTKETALDTVAPGAVVLYPIILPNRLVMLLIASNGIHQFAQDISAEDLNKMVNDYRHQLQSPYKLPLDHSQGSRQLFDWLIRPFQDQLQQLKVHTLVIIPDGSLTLIPFSTLYDGEKFLMENYAVVTAPNLTLTDPRPLDKKRAEVLIFGLSEPGVMYEKLPAVREEVDQIADITGGKVIVDSAFTPMRVDKELRRKNYRIIHMATHGKFHRDPEKTFLATHKGKISLNKLEELIKFSQFREDPLELLTLSACETALGDEVAALGLAGVAVKSGARSVIASLWQVSDKAAMELMTEFYRQYFQNPRLTKAKALQIAQKKLMTSNEFSHPSQWAPFLIIGNWL